MNVLGRRLSFSSKFRTYSNRDFAMNGRDEGWSPKCMISSVGPTGPGEKVSHGHLDCRQYRISSLLLRSCPFPPQLSHVMALSRTHTASDSLILRVTRSHATRKFSTTLPRLESYYNPWSSKSHLKPPIEIPNPLPAIYAQKIILSNGSTFTSYTTAPAPAVIRLTRDVTNNQLWRPGGDRRGLGDDTEGRVGKFRKKFEGLASGSEVEAEAEAEAEREREREEGGAGLGVGKREVSFGEGDLEWMGEGAKEEILPKMPAWQVKAGQKK